MYSNHVTLVSTISRLYLIVLIFTLLLTSCKTPSIIATQAIQQGDTANNQNNYELAIKHYSTYLENAPALGVMRNLSMEADVNRKLAHAYATQGKYDESLNHLNTALNIDENLNDNALNIIEDYGQIGVTHVYLGEYLKALNSINKALELNKGMESSLKTVKKLSIADTYLSKAQLELTLGSFAECKRDAGKANSIYLKEDDDGQGIIEVNLILSKVYLANNQIDSAIYFVNRSRKLATENDYKVYRQLQVEGNIQMQLGQPEKAILLKQKALKEAIGVNIKPQIIWAHLRLGDAYEVIGDSKKANENYKRARDIMESIGQETSSLNPSFDLRLGDIKNAYDQFNANGAKLGANIASLKIAEYLLDAGETDTVEQLLLKTNKYFSDQQVVEGMAKANLLLSIYYQSKSKYDVALTYLDEAGALKINPETQWKIDYNKGLIALAQQDLVLAENHFEKSISIIEAQRNELTRPDFKWHYLDSKIDVYDAYITMLLKTENARDEIVRKAFNLNERARSRTFLEMLAGQSLGGSDRDSKITSIESIGRQITYFKNQLESGNLGSEEKRYFQNKVGLLEKEYQENLLLVEQTNAKLSSLVSINPIPLDKVMETLDANTALLEFWVGNKNTIVWKIDRKEITYKKLNVSRSDIYKTVTKTRNLIKFGLHEKIRGSFGEIYSMLSPAFDGIFQSYDQVGIIPHGPLHFIPFEALYGNGQFIVEQSNLFYAPSSSVYYYSVNRAHEPTDYDLLGMALGELQLGGYGALPGTSLELQHLSQFYDKSQCIYDNEISESFFKEVAGNHKLIHIATHGVMNTYKPGKSYVLMAPSEKDDGKLTVDEIYELNLNSQIVTLSACETGLGDLSSGDELIGLSRAFIYAGTSAVIVSLWKVDDVSTSILMTKLHQLVDAGMPLSNALAQAQRDLIKSNFNPRASRGMQSIQWDNRLKHVVNSKETEYSSPYFWAPFIIIGNPVLKKQ